MTIFEYIKEKATKEEIAKMFCFLENDSGYYTECNVATLEFLGSGYVKNFKIEDPEDKKCFELAMMELDKQIEYKYIDTDSYKKMEG